VVVRLPPGLHRVQLSPVGVQPEMVKGIFVSILLCLFWIILAFISSGYLSHSEALDVKEGWDLTI
jgi:hypothetical protein